MTVIVAKEPATRFETAGPKWFDRNKPKLQKYASGVARQFGYKMSVSNYYVD